MSIGVGEGGLAFVVAAAFAIAASVLLHVLSHLMLSNYLDDNNVQWGFGRFLLVSVRPSRLLSLTLSVGASGFTLGWT